MLYIWRIGMSNTKYNKISLPTPMVLMLAKLVGHHGFTSVAEVVKWAIRQKQIQIDMWLDEIEERKEDTAREFGHEEH